MRYTSSQQFKRASPKDYSQFIGLKSQQYEGRAFEVDEHDARMVVANLPKKKYPVFKKQFVENRYAPFRVLQDLTRPKTASAREIFRMQYGGKRNFMTQNVEKYGKINRNVAYEVSSGRGIEPGTTLYGVSVVAHSRQKQKTFPIYGLSKPFYSKEEANEYISSLQHRMKAQRFKL